MLKNICHMVGRFHVWELKMCRCRHGRRRKKRKTRSVPVVCRKQAGRSQSKPQQNQSCLFQIGILSVSGEAGGRDEMEREGEEEREER